MTDTELADLDRDDLEVDINLRSPRDVADRLLVLAAVCRRAGLDLDPPDEAEAERFDLQAWLRAEALDPAVAPSERPLLATTVGRLNADAATGASWRAEALVALAWAANLLPAVPPYDRPADPQPALALIPAPWDKVAPFRATLLLRSEDAIACERERAELWHWRAETAALVLDATAGERAQIDDIVREVAHAASVSGAIPPAVAGDFLALGRPYRDLDAEARDQLAEIAFQRHVALNWLCGFGPDWDHVPTDA